MDFTLPKILCYVTYGTHVLGGVEVSIVFAAVFARVSAAVAFGSCASALCAPAGGGLGRGALAQGAGR